MGLIGCRFYCKPLCHKGFRALCAVSRMRESGYLPQMEFGEFGDLGHNLGVPAGVGTQIDSRIASELPENRGTPGDRITYCPVSSPCAIFQLILFIVRIALLWE